MDLIKKFFKEILLSIFGCTIAAFGTSVFLLPNQLSSGGFAGIATILYYFLDWKMGTSIIIMNIPLFIVSYFKVGKDFFMKSLISTVVFSKLIDAFSIMNLTTNDKILGSIYGGILIGIGLAIVLKSKSSTGGTDLAGQLVQLYNNKLKVPQIISFMDVTVVALNMIFFKELTIGLYSFVTIYIIEKMLDIVFEGINFCKAIYIVSEKSEEISKNLIVELDKGLTGFYGKGMYKNDDKTILLCVTKRNQLGRIRELIKKIDRNAFIIIVDAREVYGLGFK